jgi:hypothetical protein
VRSSTYEEDPLPVRGIGTARLMATVAGTRTFAVVIERHQEPAPAWARCGRRRPPTRGR